jgi:hypothetical protein
MLSSISVMPYPGGLLLDFGEPIRRALAVRPFSTQVLERRAPRYGAEMTRAFAAAQRLRRLLDPVVPIEADHVPPTSILREFIGKSGFSY